MQISIRSTKRVRHHNPKSKGQLVQQRTQKKIEQMAEKEVFFNEVMSRLEKQFKEQHLQLLIQTLEVEHQNNTRKKMIPSNTNLTIENETERHHEALTEQAEDVPFRKLDINIFQEFSKKLFTNNIVTNIHCQRKHLSTPKNNKKPQTLVLPRRLFEVDTKMRRNYDRIKQRLAMHNGDDTFRAFNSIRSSLTVGRLSKTQRAIRFRTQGQQGERWIPRMLMGDLQMKPKQRKAETRGEDRRMECFLSRYKINQ